MPGVTMIVIAVVMTVTIMTVAAMTNIVGAVIVTVTMPDMNIQGMISIGRARRCGMIIPDIARPRSFIIMSMIIGIGMDIAAIAGATNHNSSL